MVIYHAVITEKAGGKKFLDLVSRFAFVIKMVLSLLKCLKETSYYERKKEITLL